ncbi:MAG: NAD(+)/NADH kinase [Eubacterium sp.]|nr:NAD(+)/NADH kinase [Eubacterium sp.]
MDSLKRFLIIANETKDVNLKWSHYTEKVISEKGGESKLCIGVGDPSLSESFDDADVIIVMGGDGTMLGVAHVLSGREIPVVGVNLGTVGFLTEVIVSEIETMIERLIAGDYETEYRMMLAGRVISSSAETGGEALHALNEIVLARENALKLIGVRILVNDKYFDTCEADGIILSTPTGSTGYNLSAGGPIVMSDARMIVMTPISPYSLSRRSVIFGKNDKITLELLEKRKEGPNTALVSFDGADNISLMVGDKVEVGLSERRLLLIKMEEISMYDKLRKKLN